MREKSSGIATAPVGKKSIVLTLPCFCSHRASCEVRHGSERHEPEPSASRLASARPCCSPKPLRRVKPAARRLVKCGPWCHGSGRWWSSSTMKGITEWSIAAYGISAPGPGCLIVPATQPHRIPHRIQGHTRRVHPERPDDLCAGRHGGLVRRSCRVARRVLHQSCRVRKARHSPCSGHLQYNTRDGGEIPNEAVVDYRQS
mmetsp:Transcript_26775/g.42899  ORF Transcript_26775/g.42899 Transcript_26775/m.42899 type:complete len:201 (+) Transcript_26775:294-896(+)